MLLALFCDVTLCISVIPYRRFGPVFKGREIQFFLNLEDGTDKFLRNVGNELPLYAA